MTQLAIGQLRGAERVDLAEFLQREHDEVSEYMHIKFDREHRDIALFRSVGEAGQGNWIRTDLDGDVTGVDHVDGFYVTWTDVDTIMTLLDRMRVERSPVRFKIRYLPGNTSQVIDESKFDRESLVVEYETESGRSNKVQLNHVYFHPSNSFAH